MASRSRLRSLAGPAVLTVGAALLLGWAGALVLGAHGQSADAERWGMRWGAAVRAAPRAPSAEQARPVDGMDFRLRAPRIGYAAVVREGVGENVLFAGPGHYPGTPWPGQPGVVGVAAHNVYWLRFKELRPGDEILLDTRYGTFTYHVTGSAVVSPGDQSVLASAPGRHLVLTTCWPLWAGQLAPSRLAIFAS